MIGGNVSEMVRHLDEYPVFVRWNSGLRIVEKLRLRKEESLSEIVSSVSPFGLSTSAFGEDSKFSESLTLYSSKGISFLSEREVDPSNKYLKKHKMAVIDDKYIKIDHCRPLPWRLVACAEMKIARCCFKKLPIIAIKTKKPIRYSYNPLQRLCSKMDFTAFSIALYALKPSDVKKVTEIITQKTILLG